MTSLSSLRPAINTARRYSKKATEPENIADALGLLLPRKNVTPKYKPLILRNVQRGPVTEQYGELKRSILGHYEIPKVNHFQGLESVFSNLVKMPQVSRLPHDLYNQVRLLQNEEELLELFRLSYLQNKLTFKLFARFLLNKSLKDLLRLPFELNHPDLEQLKANQWAPEDLIHLRILLLKKYFDLKMPLPILRNLRQNFDTEYLPLIQKSRLSPFYERIVWKFVFDYTHMGQETNFIRSLNEVRSSFLIWEVSSDNGLLAAQTILEQHDLNLPQAVFLKVVSSNSISRVIDVQMSDPKSAGKSALLSALKRASHKFRLYSVKDFEDGIAGRALRYSLTHLLEAILNSQVPNWESDTSLKDTVNSLKQVTSEAADALSHQEVVYSS